VLDTGSPQFQTPVEDGPKLVRVDLDTNEVAETILIGDAALDTTYLNDVRFDMRRGEGGMAFITDSSSTGGIIVVDLAAKKSWRKLSDHSSTAAEEKFLPIVEGQPMMRRPEGKPASHLSVGSDGIALSADGKRLFYRPLAGRGLFSVSTDALADPELSDAKTAETITEHGNLGFASDGIIHDADGSLYLTNYEDNAVVRRTADGELETVVHDPRALWPDTLAIGPEGHLYFTANQLHRQSSFHGGEDLREKPYVLFRVDVGAEAVKLR
jgi:sugar lactone lactonase YvrE